MKSILLGSAAGIVTVAVAQAADLPTKKAAPAEYVRICNVGGMAGFLLPGSDTCFKMSGYITGQIEGGNIKDGFSWAVAPGLAAVLPGTAVNAAHFGDLFERHGFGWTTRLNFAIDARSETAYGVLRGYADMQFDYGNGFDNTGSAAGYINHAYVQWAGITAGKANSFFSFFGGGLAWANLFSPDRQGYNQPELLAYTATFGGGFSATLSAESPTGAQYAMTSGGTVLSSTGLNPAFFGSNAAYGGQRWPDIVGVLRVDQPWGSAQVSGVAHEVRLQDGAGDDLSTWGWGILGGVKINTPWSGPGDSLNLQGVWSRNAFWYSGIPDGMWGSPENGAPNGNGLPLIAADAWSNGDGSWGTPDAWSIAGTFQHHFNPQWTLGAEAAYAQVTWSGLADQAGLNCNAGVCVATGAVGSVIPKRAQSWIVGVVANWDPVPNLDFEFEVLYQSTVQSTPNGGILTQGLTQFPDNNQGFASRFEVTRNF